MGQLLIFNAAKVFEKLLITECFLVQTISLLVKTQFGFRKDSVTDETSVQLCS